MFSSLSCCDGLAAPSKVCAFAFFLSRCARRDKQSVHYRVYLVAVRPPWQAKCALSLLSCRGVLAASSKARIFKFILPRCVRRGKQSVYFLVYLVAVRPPWQAKRVLTRLSCRGALAASSKVCILAFILRCARRAKQSVNFPVYLVTVRLLALAAITRASISLFSCCSALVVCLLASHFLVYLLTHAHLECRLPPHDLSFLSILFQDVTGFYHNQKGCLIK